MLTANAINVATPIALARHSANAQANGLALQEKNHTTPGSMKVLIADDSPVYRRIVQEALCALPLQMIFASSGKQALELCKAHQPDLIILDRVMPDLLGTEFCRVLRSVSPNFMPHIIMLTGSTEKEALIEGLDAGAADYVTKPFHDEELLARVRVGIRTRELQKQVEAKNRLLEELALSDPLTGLPNRRALELWAQRELESAARHGFPFWVVMADVDRFKQVNDTFGHAAGDLVLKRFAQILRANSRSSEMCGRLGGEEFVMIFTHSSREGVLAAVERVRAELEMTNFAFSGCSFMVTSSFGICGVEPGQKPTTLPALMDSADAALYSAKRHGRNRIEAVKPGAAKHGQIR
jgi:two-component system cell cycle response regulator